MRAAVFAVGIVTCVLAGPMIHAAHDDRASAIIDLGLRLAAALVGDGIADGPEALVELDHDLFYTHERVSVAPTRGGAVVGIAGRL